MNTDIIVTPADTSLSEGNGTSRSIYLAAGEEELTRACRKIGHCDVGLAAATPAFHLHCKYILHAVSPFYEDGKHGETELLRKTYENTLSLAETSLSIAEIADRTGFGGASYFSEVFRRYSLQRPRIPRAGQKDYRTGAGRRRDIILRKFRRQARFCPAGHTASFCAEPAVHHFTSFALV